MSITSGTKLGHYEIQSPLGAGGMGEVYRARDLQLAREVAIKVLPPSLSRDPDRLRRFEQEARAAAALNYPNILAVYQMGTYEGAPYLVSELLEGGTLREQLLRGPLPLRKAVEYGIQAARGLAAAHEKGIVHRDMKPENLFVTKEGRIKILDFGLAKLTETRARVAEAGTTTMTSTEPGVVMGTVGYMSPEQVRGSAADHRSDIFAFGAILYEMLTGKRAFQRPTSAETMSAILNEDPPPVSQTAINLPPALQRVVQRCLEKSPEQRFQSASDLAFALEALSESGSASSRVISPEISHLPWKWIAAGAVVILVIASAVVWYLMPTPQPRITGSTQLTNGINPVFAMATDGSRLYFTEKRDNRAEGFALAQVSVNGGDVSVIPTTVNKPALADISPDHTELLVGTYSPEDTPIWNQPMPSGSAHPIGDLKVNWPAWSADGKQLVFTTMKRGLYMANADGSAARKIASVPDGSTTAYISPNGRLIRFSVFDAKGRAKQWEVGTDGSNLHQLFTGWHDSENQCCGRWTPDGRYYVFQSWSIGSTADDVRASDIFALAESRNLFRKNSGVPIRLTFGLLKFSNPLVSLDGRKIFVNGSQPRTELVRYDKSSKEFVPFLGGISAEDVSFSHDGKWIAYISIPDRQLWRSRVDGTERLQLTLAPGYAELPRWSPDGKSIAFTSVQEGSPPKIYLIDAEGGSPKLLVPEGYSVDPSWSPDGNQLAFATATGAPDEKESTIGIVDLKTGKVSPVPGSNGIFSPRWSPDSRYLAALSLDQKKLMLYEFKSRTWKTWLTAESSIEYPAWTADGSHVQYRTYASDNDGVWHVTLGDSKPNMLVSLKNIRGHNGVAGGWSSVAPDDSEMLVRDTNSNEIYALAVDFP